MESFGQILRDKREELKYSVYEVSKKTLISERFINALEEEREDEFSATVYFVSYMMKYADFLGLDGKKLSELFEAKKIQLAPPPMELIKREKPKFIAPLVISLSAALLIGIGVVLYFVVFKIPQRKTEKNTVVETEKIMQYRFATQVEKKRLRKGDQILIPQDEGSGDIVLTVRSTLGNIVIDTPSGSQVVELSEEREIDINGDGRSELIVYLSDVSSVDESYGAEVRLIKKTDDGTYVVFDDDGEVEVQQVQKDESEILKPVSPNAPRLEILSDTRTYPFITDITIRGSCVVRYKVDNGTPEEAYLHSGEHISVSPKNGIRLWMSNVNALGIQVQAGNVLKTLPVGVAGQVKVEDIRWIRDTSDGKYKLVVVDVE